MLRTLFSSALGAIDLLYYALRVQPGRPLFFPKGWGDVRGAQDWAQKKVIDRLSGDSKDAEDSGSSNGCPAFGSSSADKTTRSPSIVLFSFSRLNAPPQGSVLWASTKNVAYYEGSFESPVAGVLPEGCRSVPFIFVGPAPTEDEDTCKAALDLLERFERPQITESGKNAPPAVVVHLPATGEQTHALRLDIPTQLASSRGFCSFVPIAPFYGTRRPQTQIRHFIETVENLLQQSNAITVETAHLAAFAETLWPKCVVCITGFSWGGAMAVASSLIASSMLNREITRLAVVPFAGSPSPSPFTDGILQRDIDWDGLLADSQKNGIPAVLDFDSNELPAVPPEQTTLELVKDRLSKILGAMHIARFISALQKGRVKMNAESQPHQGDRYPHIDSLQSVAAGHDFFIKAPYSEELYHHMQQVTIEGNSELVWIPGGHVTAFLVRGWYWQDAIEKAVDRLL